MKRLREIRVANGLTQAEMAYRLAITTTQYQRYEAGTSLPRLDTAITIADFFGVTLDYLVGRTDVMNERVLDTEYPVRRLEQYYTLSDEHKEIVDGLVQHLCYLENR